MIAYSDRVAAEHLQVHTRDSAGFGEAAAQLRLAVHRRTGQRRLFRQMLRHQSHAADDGRGPLHRRAVGRLLCQDLHASMARERGVAAVAPPATRQSASEGLEGHRRAAALRLQWLQAKPAR
jgi:sulfopropanediol 3-dehydrogenase